MKKLLPVLAALLALAGAVPAQTNPPRPGDAAPLPTADFLVQRIAARSGETEERNDDRFDMSYQYTRTRTWEYRNRQGEVTSREEKHSVENKPERLATGHAGPAAEAESVLPPSQAAKDPALSEKHANVRNQALKGKDYAITNLLPRFQFTVIGREELNGREAFLVDFKPRSGELPGKNFADKFINKTAGRLWVDAEDYAVSQAQFWLTEKVNVFGGLVGSVWKFDSTFTRWRTPEGYWYARNVDWHLEGRELVVNRILEYHERKLDPQKIAPKADAR